VSVCIGDDDFLPFMPVGFTGRSAFVAIDSVAADSDSYSDSDLEAAEIQMSVLH
jgi:hypothetical protein